MIIHRHIKRMTYANNRIYLKKFMKNLENNFHQSIQYAASEYMTCGTTFLYIKALVNN